MTPEPLHETPENDRLVLRLFRRGDDTVEIARRYRANEAQIVRMLDRARAAERHENAVWNVGARS